MLGSSVLLLGGTYFVKDQEAVNPTAVYVVIAVMVVSLLALLLTADAIRSLIPITDAGDHYRIAKPRFRRKRDLHRRSHNLSDRINQRLKAIKEDAGPQPAWPIRASVEHEEWMRQVSARRAWRDSTDEKANAAYQDEWRAEALQIHEEYVALGIANPEFRKELDEDERSLPMVKRIADVLLIWSSKL